MAISKNKNDPNFFLRCIKSSHISFYFQTMFSKLPQQTKFSIYSATFVDLSKIAQSGQTRSKIIETWSNPPKSIGSDRSDKPDVGSIKNMNFWWSDFPQKLNFCPKKFCLNSDHVIIFVIDCNRISAQICNFVYIRYRLDLNDPILLQRNN